MHVCCVHIIDFFFFLSPVQVQKFELLWGIKKYYQKPVITSTQCEDKRFFFFFTPFFVISDIIMMVLTRIGLEFVTCV